MKMKMKILLATGIITFATFAFSQESTQTDPCAERDAHLRTMPAEGLSGTDLERFNSRRDNLNTQCEQATAAAAAGRQRDNDQARQTSAILGANRTTACKTLKDTLTDENFNPTAETASAFNSNPEIKKRADECKQLKFMSEAAGNTPFEAIDQRAERRQTLDGAITCSKKASFTVDYDACVSASKLYDGVRVAEKAMDMQQTFRTNAKQNEIQAETNKRQAEGDLQAGALDAGIANHDHMKGMMKEKIGAYTLAVGLLSKAMFTFPGEGYARKVCQGAQSEGNGQTCPNTVQSSRSLILANGDTKGKLVTAIAEFTAKGIAAYQAMGAHEQAAKLIGDTKPAFEDEPQDLMLERCQFNPADPGCLTPGERVSGGGIARGEFGLGDGGNNAFNLTPESGEFGEVGVETSLDDGNEVSSINNPFADDAKIANGILNPASAAQVQATGGAGGGSGGGGGGLGGGGASLGSDLAGADKDGDKEAQIKAGKVSGIYGAVGGGGYRGIARSKENANPFASLFDKKGSAGGAEVDGSIPADIDGKASGLFQKISKRYTRIHADKRIEARNLE